MSTRFDVSLGHGGDGPLSLSQEARETHLHVMGLSRQGKSYFLEHCIRQDIENGAGVCVIDPHGEMYKNLVDWLAANDMQKRRRIHLINPAKGDWSVGFNPLCMNDSFLKARVSSMIDACQKVWGDTESTGHKTLANLLEMVFSTLAHHKLSLREASLLTTLNHRQTRHRLVNETGNAELIDKWSELDHLKPQEFVQTFNAVTNRLRALTGSPGISSMIAQTDDVIDFKACMENGHVVLVNLAHEGRIPPQVSETLGALITADLYHSAQSRDIGRAKQRPFYCYIDECGDYLNETVVKGLDQTAKFGLHYILSHQRLSQLGARRDDPIRNGVMGGAQSKVVFLQDDADTASEISELLFGKEFDFERPKEVLIKPTVVGYSREWLEAEASAEGNFDGQMQGNMNVTGSGQSLLDIDDATPINISSDNYGSSDGYSFGKSAVTSRSSHEALVPILEDMPGGVYSIEELKHIAAVEVRLLKKRQAFAYRADDRVALQFATADIHPARPTLDQIDDFYNGIRDREPSAKQVDEVEAATAERRRRLLNEQSDHSRPMNADDFYED